MVFIHVGNHVVFENVGKNLSRFYVVLGLKTCRLENYFIVTLHLFPVFVDNHQKMVSSMYVQWLSKV